ncbi:MAG TPA: hypothetical protein VL860_08325 [Planctomycetota bacterium]|nr:hypothetical protein [Planctomycetota bacterium]
MSGAAFPKVAAASTASTGAESSEPVRLPQTLERLGKKVLAGEIARLVGHEINNHLQGIIGLADLLGEEAPDPGAKASLLQIKLQAERIAGLQRSLSKLLAVPRREESLQPIDLSSLWREIEDLIHGALTRRQIKLWVEMPASLPACQGDADSMSQLMMLAVLWHFKSLERRANWGENRPELTVCVKVVATPQGPALEWVSRDNGAGLPAVMNPAPSPEEHPELYDDLSTIGLLHLLQIVHLHKARLATKSDEQTGLELQITLVCG